MAVNFEKYVVISVIQEHRVKYKVQRAMIVKKAP